MPVTPAGPPTAPRPVAAPDPSPAGFASVLEARGARALAPPAPPAPAPPGPRALDALRGIEQAQRRLDAVLEAARRGRIFTAQELLALQATAYRYAQTVDVAARVVEQGAQSVKQATNTQV